MFHNHILLIYIYVAAKVQQVFNNCKKPKKPRKTEKPKNGKNQNQYKTPKKNKNKKEDFPYNPL